MTTITSTSIASVFDIYYLQTQICADLTPRDLRRCCLVSRDFYHNFVPFLYQTITISRRATYNKFIRAESLQALYRYRQHVNQVTCVFAELWKIILDHQCYNLKAIRSLSLPKRHHNQETNKHRFRYLFNLIRICSDLHLVELDHFWLEESIVEHFCRVIRNHDGLRELRIGYTDSYPRFRYTELPLWSALKLDRISVGSTMSSYQTGRATPEEVQELIDLTGEKDPIFPIRELDLSFQLFNTDGGYALQRYLRRCPYLERLAVPDHFYRNVISDLAKVISESLPNLQHLDLRSMSATVDTVDMLISACNNLKSFAFRPKKSSVDHVVTALLKHCNSLEEVYLDGGCKITSQQIQTILSSFSKLQVFDAMTPYLKIDYRPEELTREGGGDPILNVTDMLGDTTPWICHNLKVLKLRFAHNTHRDGVHEGDDMDVGDGLTRVFPRVLYEQIGKMKELKVLWLGRVENGNYVHRRMMIHAGDRVEGLVGPYSVSHCMKMLSRHRERVDDMTRGIQELEKLEKLEELELRNLGQYIPWSVIWGAKSNSWRRMKKLNYR